MSIKVPMPFLEEAEKPILKFIWNLKGPWVAKIILKRKNKVGGLILSDSNTYYKATVIKICDAGIKQTHTTMEENREVRNKSCNR